MTFDAGAGAGAIRIGAVVAASSILAGAGIEAFAVGGAAMAPDSFNAGGNVGEGLGEGVNVEVEVAGGGAAAAGALVGATANFGATLAGASAGSWI